MKRKQIVRSLALGIVLATALAACTTVRQAKPLNYGGDGRDTVASIEAELARRGYKPICRERTFCKFQFKEDVWVHFKASKARVVLVVDVKGGTEMAAAQVDQLNAEAQAAGEEIFAQASADANERSRLAAIKAKADADAEAARKRDEQARKDAEPDNGGGGVLGVLGGVGRAMDQVNVNPHRQPGGGNSSGGSGGASRCCVNGSYYACSSAAALDKCAGETSRCLAGCMNNSDMSCPDKCMHDHPPDPSGCTRMTDKDGECHR